MDERSLSYPGWRIVIVCFTLTLFGFGFGFYGHSFYLAGADDTPGQRHPKARNQHGVGCNDCLLSRDGVAYAVRQ